ncbi:ABC transporter permease [Haloplanus aerogenes]|uniref:ABC transporter permease n=1 Tax=Haloplanus aerogenes TaxID=660522 RepID=A0A3M0DI36_9EURY|nr:ABC transporter permease [Haloplanus aerogenes]AZH26131.1 ABC transporter permease [Haloplanus aerogenes]RMB18416.1 putative ABC transport system permease protein [Haloplanus aerogenes]
MDAVESVRIALRSIRSHKLRSTLTVVGLVIGIASVIVFATFGASVKAEVINDIEGSSANNVYVFATPEDDEGFDQVIQPVFTEHDVSSLASLPGVTNVIPRGTVDANSLTHGSDTIARQRVTATTPETFDEEKIVAGRGFRSGTNEVVLNERAARSFDENVTVGDRLTLSLAGNRTRELTVVGIVNGTEGQLPVSGFAEQARVYVPVDPFYRTVVESPSVGVRQRAYPQVTVVTDPTTTAATKAAVESYLQERSDARQLAPAGTTLTARTSGDFVAEVASVIERITRFVTGVAVIGLVVGAIGIANIMLVSVTERTREIGVMKAVGARNRDVLVLFLVEAGLLGAIGAVLALPIGLVVGYAATRYAEVTFALAPAWMVTAVVVGVVVGVLAGLYPAWRAARVDPIDALRYE